MSTQAEIAELRALMQHRRHYLVEGRSDTWLRAAVRSGELLRIAHGWYVRRVAWETLPNRSRHLLRALVLQANCGERQVFSHGTAALLLELPMFRFDGNRVHTLAAAGVGSRSSDLVRRHRAPFEEGELRQTAGLTHTGVARTAIDIARSTSFDCGVVTVDAALRRLAGGLPSAGEERRASLLEHLEGLPRSGGLRRARAVLRFASVLSESPLESLARLQLERLGFAVRQQVEVPGPNGEVLRMDLELVGYDVFMEVDGRQKYLDERMRRGRSVEEVLLDEKSREDWVRGSRGCRIVRGGWEHATAASSMAARLRSFNIEPPILLGGAPRHHLY